MDEGELGWTSANTPQTVLKTAGLASFSVHQRPLEFDRRLADSTFVRCRPQASGNLAVMLGLLPNPD